MRLGLPTGRPTALKELRQNCASVEFKAKIPAKRSLAHPLHHSAPYQLRMDGPTWIAAGYVSLTPPLRLRSNPSPDRMPSRGEGGDRLGKSHERGTSRAAKSSQPVSLGYLIEPMMPAGRSQTLHLGHRTGSKTCRYVLQLKSW